jgi:beta-1,4-N-acetylglucosaminyltransferase
MIGGLEGRGLSSDSGGFLEGFVSMKKVGIVCSSGGHLTEALSIVEVFKGHDVFLIVHDFPSLKETQFEGIHRIHKLRILLGYSSWTAVFITNFVNLFQLLRIFWIEKPSLLFSTGAEIAVPAFYVGKFLFRTKLIFLESLARVKGVSFAGKLLYPIVDLFLVQWPELLSEERPRAVYRGRLI